MYLSYVLREAGTNLRRNAGIAAAAVLCVAVSLALVGAALLARQGVAQATQRWQDGVEFIVFMQPTATDDQYANLAQNLAANPAVERARFFDQQAAFAEFTDMFADSPDMLQTVTPDILPASFRVVPVDTSPEAVDDLVAQYRSQPGVFQVAQSTEAVVAVQALSDVLSLWGVAVAGVLLVVAVLVIATTIQLAIFSRRREIEVMQLVGASKGFIRIPFMVEGLVQGLVGAVAGMAALAVFHRVFEASLPSSQELPVFGEVSFSSVDLTGTYLALLVVGAAVGTAASALASSWFLNQPHRAARR